MTMMNKVSVLSFRDNFFECLFYMYKQKIYDDG